MIIHRYDKRLVIVCLLLVLLSLTFWTGSRYARCTGRDAHRGNHDQLVVHQQARHDLWGARRGAASASGTGYDPINVAACTAAGVDVWVVEPPPMDHQLLTFDNVLATYHTAGVTEDSRILMAQWNADQVVQILRGERPPRLINPEAWDPFSMRLEQAFGFKPA